MITPPFRPLPAAFQSTHPLRGATACSASFVRISGFQSTHPLRGATQHHRGDRRERHISIHAPLAGCDRNGSASRRGCRHFNPRTPCGVRRCMRTLWPCRWIFQSTHPLRGATITCKCLTKRAKISIHAPLAGCDNAFWSGFSHGGRFQSTHPLRGATSGDCFVVFGMRISIHAPLAGCDDHGGDPAETEAISIHAPLAGCDRHVRGLHAHRPDFNPRTPCGVRR